MSDPAQVWNAKKIQLEALVTMYDRVLSLTGSAEADAIATAMRDADRIVEALRAIDDELRASSWPLFPVEPSAEDSALAERLQTLNRQVTKALEQQRDEVRSHIDEARQVRKTIDHYRPYDGSESKRIDCSV